VPNQEAGARTFPETGKKMGGSFMRYWDTHGGLRQQGLPISDEFIEVNGLDGKPYRVQYFERAVMEYHPEFAGTDNEVLLSQLGTFRYQDEYQRPTATPTTPGTPTPAAPSATPTRVPPTATPVPEDPCADIPASVNMTVSPNCGRPNTTVFTFKGSGFQAGELVGVYATSPDGAVYGAPFQLEALADGTTEEVYLGPLPSSLLGIWAVTMEGVTSHTRAIGYVKLVTNPTPPGGGQACDPSGSVNGSANPGSGGPGDVIVITASGFTPGEDVSFWFTLPDGAVVGTPQPFPGFVNPDGTIGPLDFEIDEELVELATGKWAITFQGADSDNVAIIYFCVHE
jgi:hypothetical protein